MSTEANRPSATDLLAVKSRVSWGAIAAGGMIALTIYVILALLGVAVGVETAVRGPNVYFGTGAAIYAIFSLLLAMFFGGWATSRLAVGESKLEAVLYGVILWGALFAGMMWLVTAGIQTGFGAMVGVASGAYSDNDGAWTSTGSPVICSVLGPTRRPSASTASITNASATTRWPRATSAARSPRTRTRRRAAAMLPRSPGGLRGGRSQVSWSRWRR